MNTLEIKLSPEKSLDFTKKYKDTVELFLLRNQITYTEEQLTQLHEDFASYTKTINLGISE